MASKCDPLTNHPFPSMIVSTCHRESSSIQVGGDDGRQQRHQVLRRLYMATAICSFFFFVEVVGGWLAGSLAVMSDAAHLFADLASFCVAIIASHLASLPSTTTHTFGLRRAESLAALMSMASLAVVSIGLAIEAIRRMLFVSKEHVSEVDGPLMSTIAAIGVVVNILLALVLGGEHTHMPGGGHDHSHEGHDHSHNHSHSHDDHHTTSHDMGQHSPIQPATIETLIATTIHDNHQDHDHHHDDSEKGLLLAHDDHGSADLCTKYNSISHPDEAVPVGVEKPQENINLKAAYLHVLGDLAQSLAVLLAGLIIWIFPKQAQIIDPLCTLLFCMLVFYSTLSVLRSSVAVLLEEIPPKIDWMQVYEAISAVPDISNVHDLHIWCISYGEPSISVHCMSQRPNPDDALQDIYSVCQRFGITHATIQLQHTRDFCITCQPQISSGKDY